MPRLPVVGADNNQWGSLLNEFLVVAHRPDGTLRSGSSMLDVRDFGVVGNGVADDSVALNNCLKAASDDGKTVFIPSGMNIRVIRNLFIYGNASIVGENKYQCKITLDGDLEAQGAGMSAYWVNFGIASKGGMVSAWTGSISNLQFYITAGGLGTGPNLHAIQFHRAEDFAFENCIIDLRPVGHANCAAMVSQIDGGWCSSPGAARGRIANNLVFGENNGSPATGGSGGINLVGLKHGLIANNRVEGFADDAIAMIDCSHCVVRDNWVKGVRSRVAAFSGSDITFLSNYLERQAGVDGIWVANTDFYAAHLAGPYSAAPENIKFIGNTALLPAQAVDGGGYHNFLDLGGVRGCVANGNIFICDSNQTNKTRLLTWVFTAFPTWTDPTGQDPPGKSRPYRIMLSNNLLTGQYPGQIEEAATLASDLVGPILYEGNLASTSPRLI
ncbi:MAG: glycosyl hydrolase family 28-related protein [Chloroflexota bacterium]